MIEDPVYRLLRDHGLTDVLNAVQNLPRLACGSICYPGRTIGREYLGNPWEARIVYVGDSTIDIQYTNQGTHASKGLCFSVA